MLTHFPTPYPNEWWYSVLCRYHVRSGYSKNQTTVGELFGGKVLAQMGALFPNSTILRVYDQLPQDIFRIRNCVIKNTLFPYFTRFYTQQEKENMLSQIEQGKSIVTTSIRRFSDFQGWAPKYCPLCYQADRDRYGEAYWHVEHQISLAKICTEHRCRLVKSNIDPTHLSYAFFPLDAIKTVESPCTDTLDLEYELSSILFSYQLLPLEYGVTIGYNNLAIALANMGYEVTQKYSEHTILDAQRLYRDMVDLFGKALVTQAFGYEKSIPMINRLCKWEMRSPVRFALLQCFSHITQEAFFGPELASSWKAKLSGYQDTQVIYSRKQIACEMGVTAAQLDTLVQKYGIQIRWQDEERKEDRPHKITFTLNDIEMDLFKRVMREKGYKYGAHFAREIILDQIKKEHSCC